MDEHQVPPGRVRDLQGTGPAEDDGLFGASSTTWRVHVEPVLWAGGFRALLLQALHPRVMRGTQQNSVLFDPEQAWSRFEHTSAFVGTRTFGSSRDVARAGRRVRAMHSRLTGFDPDTGTRFRIDDPELLLWVHCAEIDSYLDVACRAGILRTDVEADEYVAESRRAAAVVGIHPTAAPGSRAEMAAYVDQVRPGLRACPEAVDALARMLNPPLPPRLRALKLAAPAVTALAFSLLPRWARRLYGAPGLRATDRAATLAVRALHTAVRVLPDPPAPAPVERARRLVRAAQH